MMTTAAALLAGVPLALGNGTGSELRQPLGYAMVGGLALSQLLTLYTTPVVYLYLDRLRHWLQGGRRAPAARRAWKRRCPPRRSDACRSACRMRCSRSTIHCAASLRLLPIVGLRPHRPVITKA